MTSPIDLQKARAEAATRMSDLGKQWVAAYGIASIEPSGGLHGRAWPLRRRIVAPWPTTTRKRLYILAHEIGHVALKHDAKLPSYVKEFEAEWFAINLMRRCGVAVPSDMLKRAKSYVGRKIMQAHTRGLQSLDPDIDRWANGNGAKGYAKKAAYHARALERVAAAVSLFGGVS